MKKNKTIEAIDLAGNIKIIPTSKIKSKTKQNKKIIYSGYLNIGFYLVIPIVAGVFLGSTLDYWLKTKPVFVVFFIFLGTLASFYNLFKLTRRDDTTLLSK